MREPAGHIARVQTSGVHPWFAAFFAFGATMCALTVGLLLFPGSSLDSLWRLNPDARLAFASLGYWSLVLMATVYRGLIGVPVAGAMIFFLLACGRRSKDFLTR